MLLWQMCLPPNAALATHAHEISTVTRTATLAEPQLPLPALHRQPAWTPPSLSVACHTIPAYIRIAVILLQDAAHVAIEAGSAKQFGI